MVNRVLTSPYLWWSDPFLAGPDASDRLPFSSAGLNPNGNDRFIRRGTGRQPETRRPERALAVCPGDRAPGPLSAGKTADHAVARRAAAPDTDLCRPGAGQKPR